MKWLFFDIGSTLVDETECYRDRVDLVTAKNKINKNEFIRKVYEYAETSDCAVKAAIAFYGAALPKWNGELERLYPNVTETLEKLSQKYRLGIIANQALGAKNRLDSWGIGKYFDVIVASAEEGCAKPDVRIFEAALEHADCKPSEAVMVGDRLDNDILPAKKLGMKTVWVKQGFAKYRNIISETEQADFIIESIDDLLEFL